MQEVFKVGPLEDEEAPSLSVYVSAGSRGMWSAEALDDALGLQALAKSGALAGASVEPALEVAAGRFGLKVRELSEPALRARLALALTLHCGLEGTERNAAVLVELA